MMLICDDTVTALVVCVCVCVCGYNAVNLQ